MGFRIGNYDCPTRRMSSNCVYRGNRPSPAKKFGNQHLNAGEIDPSNPGVVPIHPDQPIVPLPTNTGHNSIIYTIPFRNDIMVNDLSHHLNMMRSSLNRSGVSISTINQIVGDLNYHMPPFLEWARRQPTGNRLTSSNYLNAVGGLRTCSACPGDVGSCSGACAQLDIETNIGGNNWSGDS